MAVGVVVKASQNWQGRESCERAKREKATEKVGVPGSLFVFRGCLSLSVAVLFSCAFSAVLWSAKARSLCGRKKIKVRKRREKDAVTDKETMFPFRSNTSGKNMNLKIQVAFFPRALLFCFRVPRRVTSRNDEQP